MKEAVEFVEALSKLTSSWAIAATLALTIPGAFKRLLELASMSHATREKKLSLLLKYADAGIEKSARFSVEQAFQMYYGVLVDFDIIKRLWDHVAASAHIQNYIWGRSFLRFDRKSRLFSFNKDYNWKLRGAFLLLAFAVAYLTAAISGVTGLIFLVAGSWGEAMQSFSLFGLMSAGVGVVILAARASRAARDVVEQQADVVSDREGVVAAADPLTKESTEHEGAEPHAAIQLR